MHAARPVLPQNASVPRRVVVDDAGEESLDLGPGSVEILDLLDFDDAKRRGREKIQHPGTYNANPVSAAAGIAALGIIGAGDACARANASASSLRAALNEVLEAEGVPWAVYGTFSGFHIFTNPRKLPIRPSAFDPFTLPFDALKAQAPDLVQKLRLAMLLHGVDIGGWPGGLLSAAHSEADLADTADAFRASLRLLKQEGEL